MNKIVLFNERLFNKIETKIEVYRNLTLITGDSGTGKTFLFDSMKAIEKINKNSKYIFINIDNCNELKRLKSLSGYIIIIDNADIILTENTRKYISSDKNNYYLIFGRDNRYLKTGAFNIAHINYNGHKLELEFPFIGLVLGVE